MQPLTIDFHRTRCSAPWAGPLLAMLALALSAEVGLSYQRAREATAAAELRFATLGRQAERNRNAAPQAGATREELAAARDAFQRLSTPWDKLFGAIESSANGKVALTGIEPDPKAGTVLISGESPDYLAALNYVLELERGGTLTQPHLVRHERRDQDARGGVAFSIAASWSAGR
jgi:hypothetical protein